MPNRILLAEIDSNIRDNLSRELEMLGYEVSVAGVATTQDILDQARERHPDVIIAAATFRQTDSPTVCEMLVSEQIAPVLLLTEDMTSSQLERAKTSGVMGCLIMPWDAQSLMPAIEFAMQRYSQLQILQAKATSLEAQLTTRITRERAQGQEQQKLPGADENARWRQDQLRPGLTAAESYLYWLWKQYIDDNPDTTP